MKKTNFDGIKKTAHKNFIEEINWGLDTETKKSFKKCILCGIFGIIIFCVTIAVIFPDFTINLFTK